MKAVSELVAELEGENIRLKELAAKQDRFIELVAPSVTRLESFYDRISQDYVDIVDAYRAIRPKKAKARESEE